MKRKVFELEESDNIKIWIAKRRDGFVVTLTGNDDWLIFQLYQIRGSVTVVDERAATSPSSFSQSPLSAHPSASALPSGDSAPSL